MHLVIWLFVKTVKYCIFIFINICQRRFTIVIQLLSALFLFVFPCFVASHVKLHSKLLAGNFLSIRKAFEMLLSFFFDNLVVALMSICVQNVKMSALVA